MRNTEPAKFIYFFTYVLVKTVLNLLFVLRIQGRENVPLKGPCILAANHVSFFDAPTIAVACPRQVHFLARKTLFDRRPFSTLISSLGAFPIERQRPRQALRTSLSILRGDRCLLVFPEGTRSKSGRMQEGQPGIGFLAIRGRCPVIPVHISGTERVFPVGAKWIHPGPVTVSFGAPLLFNGTDYTEIVFSIMRAVGELP